MADHAIDYTTVTWTSGDTITEAKLDNMVSNDQAHDAHAADGYTLNNNVAFQVKKVGGTAVDIFKMDTSDDLICGDSDKAMLNFVPRDPGGWDFDHSNSSGTSDDDLSSIVSTNAVGVKVRVMYKLGGGRQFELYAKDKTDDWDMMQWYSWNDSEALSGRERVSTHDFFFTAITNQELTAYRSSGWGSSEVFKYSVIGWWEPVAG